MSPSVGGILEPKNDELSAIRYNVSQRSVSVRNGVLHVARTRGRIWACMTILSLVVALPPRAYAQSLSDFAILAGSTITNTGITTVDGSIGVSPGTAITNTGAFVLTGGTIHAADGVAAQAQHDLTNTYNVLMGLPSTALSGDLGGQTLTAGVYSFASSAQLTGILTLQGGANDVFVIQIGSTLTTASASSVVLSGAVNPANVFFVVGSSATLGTSTAFKGQIVALTSITLNTTASIDCGAAWARNGAVTLQNNTIDICTFSVASGGTGTSGEIATGVAPSALQGMNSFLNLALNGERGVGVVSSPGESMSPGTVSVMGYSAQGSSVANSAFASFDHGAKYATTDRAAEFWVGGFGDFSQTTGDAAVGSHNRNSRDFGLAAGVDYHLTGDGKVGFAVAGGGADFGLSDNLGSGHLTTLEVAAYARKSFGEAYVAGALGYSNSAVSTSRNLTLAGIDNLTAQFTAQDLAGQIEGGYKFGLFTPYAAVRGHAFMTPAYSESASSGNSTFALAYDGHTVITTRTEVGVKFDWTKDYDYGVVGLHSTAAWAHDFWSGNSMSASFLNLPGLKFAVPGASADADSLLLSAGADLGLPSGFILSAAVNGDFARNARTYGGTARIDYSW
jgi:uncharacterized protein with beta-barrel porin domain